MKPVECQTEYTNALKNEFQKSDKDYIINYIKVIH